MIVVIVAKPDFSTAKRSLQKFPVVSAPVEELLQALDRKRVRVVLMQAG